MGLRPTQGDENRLKGTAFRPSVTITITVALAAEETFSTERSGGSVPSTNIQFQCTSMGISRSISSTIVV